MIDYTKEELVSLLEHSPEKFNEWKKGRSDVDLSEIDFSNTTIREVDLSNVDLNSSSFSDCVLSLVNFSESDLSSTDFTRAKVEECDFSDATLAGAECSYSEMTYCNFSGCDLAGTVLSEAVLTGSDFSSSENLVAARFDTDTVWPDDDMLPEGFDSTYSDDLSALKDDEESMAGDY